MTFLRWNGRPEDRKMGDNVYVKIPVTNTWASRPSADPPSYPVGCQTERHRIDDAGSGTRCEVLRWQRDRPAFVSFLLAVWADTGRDPVPAMAASRWNWYGCTQTLN